MSALYTTVTNPDFYEAIVESAIECEANWTVSRRIEPGDGILLYVTAPVCAIVATAVAATQPEQDSDPQSPWFGSWLVDMEQLRMLERPVTRAGLLEAFPAWRYWRQPRQSVRVPGEYAAPLERLLEQ